MSRAIFYDPSDAHAGLLDKCFGHAHALACSHGKEHVKRAHRAWRRDALSAATPEGAAGLALAHAASVGALDSYHAAMHAEGIGGLADTIVGSPGWVVGEVPDGGYSVLRLLTDGGEGATSLLRDAGATAMQALRDTGAGAYEIAHQVVQVPENIANAPVLATERLLKGAGAGVERVTKAIGDDVGSTTDTAVLVTGAVAAFGLYLLFKE